MEQCKIFGTPSEPLFNNNFGLSPLLLEENLHNLAEDNEKRIDMANEKQGHFKNGKNAGIYRKKHRMFWMFLKHGIG